jgi:nicotinic acetylcholine receptor, invertebrate
VYIFLSLSLTGIHAGSHEKRLLQQLLDQYNVLERPVANESDPLQLSFGLTLMQIIDVVSVHFSIIEFIFQRLNDHI